MTSVLFVRATCTSVDYVDPSTGRSQYSGETIEQLQARYPGAEVMPIDQAIALTEAKFLSEPEPITAEQFQHYLEVLPPENWQQFIHGEVFQMIERTSGRGHWNLRAGGHAPLRLAGSRRHPGTSAVREGAQGGGIMSIVTLQVLKVGPRTFVLRQFKSRAKFPFEIAEKTTDGVYTNPKAYGLKRLAASAMVKRAMEVVSQ